MEQGIHIYVSIPIVIRYEKEICRSCLAVSKSLCNEESVRPSNKFITLFKNVPLFSLDIFWLLSSSK